MKTLLVALLVIPSLFASFEVKAQDAPLPEVPATADPPEPSRDATDVAVVESAVAALGGRGVLSQVSDSVTTGDIQPKERNPFGSRSFVWKTVGDEFRYEFQSARGLQVYTSGHGRPAVLKEDGRVRQIFAHMAMANPPLHLPGVVLLRELMDPSYSITLEDVGLVGGTAAACVRTRSERHVVARTLTPQVWCFDLVTGLPLRVGYRIAQNLNASRSREGSAEFSDFRSVNGILVPFRIDADEGPQQKSLITVKSVAFDTGVNPAEFDAPTGGDQ